MTETRRLNIIRRSFTRNDLVAIGKIFLEEYSIARRHSNPHYTAKFTLRFEDGTSYESEELNHFAEGAEIDFKHANLIEFSFHDFRLDKTMNLELDQGIFPKGRLSISGIDQAWVNGTFTKLQERISAAKPTESWFNKHPVLTFNLIALGIGSILLFLLVNVIQFAIAAGLIVFERASGTVVAEDRFRMLNHPFNYLIIVWGLRWFFGALAAFWIRDWVLNAWPNIDSTRALNI